MSRVQSIAFGNPHFAANLARLMKQQAIRDSRLARWMGLSREMIGQWRKGKAIPIDERFSALCVALKCRPEDLLSPQTDEPDAIPIAEWAKREGIPDQRARDLFAFRILTGERRTAFGILVPIDLKAPPDSKTLVLVAKRRPRWVPAFHQNFPRLVEKRGVKRGKLADRVGVQSNAIAHWMKGRNYPLAERIPDIAKALGVSVRDLIGDIRP